MESSVGDSSSDLVRTSTSQNRTFRTNSLAPRDELLQFIVKLSPVPEPTVSDENKVSKPVTSKSAAGITSQFNIPSTSRNCPRKRSDKRWLRVSTKCVKQGIPF